MLLDMQGRTLAKATEHRACRRSYVSDWAAHRMAPLLRRGFCSQRRVKREAAPALSIRNL
jgi:hypothetical protein